MPRLPSNFLSGLSISIIWPSRWLSRPVQQQAVAVPESRLIGPDVRGVGVKAPEFPLGYTIAIR